MKYIDQKYLQLLSPQLDQFKRKNANLYVFRCPICGDSERDKTKARGYVFAVDNTLIFKCHNCGDSRSIGRLLEALDSRLADEYRMEMFEARHGKRKNYKSVEDLLTPAPLFLQNDPSLVLLKLPGVCRLLDMDECDQAPSFLRNRGIPRKKWGRLFYCEDEHVLEALSEKYHNKIKRHAKRILLPFTDRAGNMTGLAGRALEPNELRYLTIKLVDNQPLIFNFDKWDSTRYTYVCEGQLDSLFLPNAISVGGSDLKKVQALVDKHNTVFVFDNEPRNREIISKMRGLINSGYSVCIWPSDIQQKDINDMVLHGLDERNVKVVIDLNTSSGLEAELKLNDWSRI